MKYVVASIGDPLTSLETTVANLRGDQLSGTRVKVDGGKYEFVVDKGSISILRYDQKWVEKFTSQGDNAVMSLIFELDLAREQLAIAKERAGPAGWRLLGELLDYRKGRK